MNFNPLAPANYNWHYSDSSQPDYSTTLVGTVIAVQQVQKRSYVRGDGVGQPEFWPDGNPKMNIRVAFALENGELRTFVFQPATRKMVAEGKRSVHSDLYRAGNGEIVGKTFKIETWDVNPGIPPEKQGQPWGLGNPRLFEVTLVDDKPLYSLTSDLPEEYKLPKVLCNDAVQGGAYVQQQPMAQPATQQQQPMMQQQPMQAQPMMQQPIQAQPMMQQPMQAQPVMQQQPMAQPQQVQPMQPMVPAGMDPAVAAAMQGLAPTTVSQVGASVYDEQIPF